MSKLRCALERQRQLAEYFEYIEAHKGTLRYSPGPSEWQDGEVTDGAWIFSADSIHTRKKTLEAAILTHKLCFYKHQGYD